MIGLLYTPASKDYMVVRCLPALVGIIDTFTQRETVRTFAHMIGYTQSHITKYNILSWLFLFIPPNMWVYYIYNLEHTYPDLIQYPSGYALEQVTLVGLTNSL